MRRMYLVTYVMQPLNGCAKGLSCIYQAIEGFGERPIGSEIGSRIRWEVRAKSLFFWRCHGPD